MQEMLVSSSSSPNTHSTYRTALTQLVIHSLNKLTPSTFSVRDCAKHWGALPSKLDTEIKRVYSHITHNILCRRPFDSYELNSC